MRALWQNETNLCPHSYTTWKIVHPSSFLTRRMVGRDDLIPEILGQTDPVGVKTPIQSIFTQRLSRNTLKIQLSVIVSPLRPFHWALDEHNTLHLSSQRGLKNAKWPFSVKKCTSLEESMIQSFFVWILSATTCKAFTGLSIRAKSSRGTCPATWKFGQNWPTPFKNANFQHLAKKVQLTRIGSPLWAFQWA